MTINRESSEDPSLKRNIGLVQNKNASEKERKHAFFDLVYTLRQDLLQKCEIVCRQYGHDVNTAELITDATFEKFLEKGKFIVDYSEDGILKNRFLRYLYGISYHLLVDVHRKKKRDEANPYDGTESIVLELPSIDPETIEDLETRTMYEVVKSYPKSHQIAYLTYMIHQKAGFNLPSHLRTALREALGGIKQSTVAGYVKKVRDKIEYTIDLKNNL